MSRTHLAYTVAAIATATVVGVTVYRASRGTCGCEQRKTWLRTRGLWPEKKETI
jgi:hypothetical protein